jgi:hypothetical protein
MARGANITVRQSAAKTGSPNPIGATMRKLQFVLPAVLLISSAVASAAPAPAKNTPLRLPTAQQMQEMEGSYALADGRIAQIIALDDRLYVEVNHRDRRELVATGEDKFETRDRAISIEYKPTRGGEILMRRDSQ